MLVLRGVVFGYLVEFQRSNRFRNENSGIAVWFDLLNSKILSLNFCYSQKTHGSRHDTINVLRINKKAFKDYLKSLI